MKRLYFILLLVGSLCAFSCKKSENLQFLADVDRLIYENPDSAMELLDSLSKEITNYSQSVQMYFQLLTVKARDKAYITHTSDSLILSVIDYYTRTENKEHLPEAYYYGGRVYRDMGDTPRAISYFYSTLEALKGENDNWAIKNVAVSQIGSLFSEQCMYPEAIEAYKEAYEISLQENDSIGMIYDLRDIGSTFMDMDRLDSASVYIRKAYQHACKIKNEHMKGMIEGLLASLYTESEDYEQAKYYINLSLESVDERKQSATYSIAAELYHKVGNKDSALYFYRALMDCGELYARADAAWNLAQYALEKNNSGEAGSYLKQYIADIDSVWLRNDTENIRQLRSMYNYNLWEKENNRLKLQSEQKRIYLIGAVSLALILLACLVIYFQYSQKERLRLKLQLEKLKYLEENRDIRVVTNQNLREKFKDTAICQYFIQSSKQALYNIPDDRWEALRGALNENFDNFVDKLQDIRKLNTFELRVCMLLKINFSPKDIALFTHHSKEAVSSARRRMYEKFFGCKAVPRDWDDFINSL